MYYAVDSMLRVGVPLDVRLDGYDATCCTLMLSVWLAMHCWLVRWIAGTRGATAACDLTWKRWVSVVPSWWVP